MGRRIRPTGRSTRPTGRSPRPRASLVVAVTLVAVAAACGPPPPPSSQLPVVVQGLTGASQLEAAPEHGCAVTGGPVRCWGAAYPPATASAAPVTVADLSDVVQVAAGMDHACALRSDATVACWGLNHVGQLGTGSPGPSSGPVAVAGLSGVIRVSVGEALSCALLGGGTVACWGRNGAGQLGRGFTSDFEATPAPVVGLTGADQVAVGDGTLGSVCARFADGSVRCWGANHVGQLGDGTTTDASVPVPVVGLSDATQVAVGGGTACALVSGGAARCWGSNQVGQLGDGSMTDSPVPVDVDDLSGATQLAVGNAVSCALTAAGTVRCWGSNIYGSLGTPTPAYWSGTPVQVAGITTATQVSAGWNQACALLADGTARCWGSDFVGELGNG